ncbi:hypothetical protein FACS1894133_4440 [Clostridia bacterium]|nr:hypothetical protein FACS1894133_4440 [Clostridia bacterium]
MAKETTTLAVQSEGFLSLANFDFTTDISEVLDGMNISFGKIKIQTGAYEVPNEDGDTEAVPEFNGVILFNHALNMYYKTDYNGGNQPPDCGSFDGKVGTGDPGGNCKKCPLNQFGTAKDSKGNPNKGKACKNRQRVYVLREGEMFPMVFSLPTGSLTGFGKYLTAQLSKGRRPSQYVTRFSLKKAQSSEGKPYSQAQFSIDRVLTTEEHALVMKLAEQVKAYALTAGYDQSDIINLDDDNPYFDPETGEVIEPLGGNHV